MTTPFGKHESLMRPDDRSGRYWASPPCRVRVDDGKNVSWIDLKRPYALVGSHSCCTLRIRSTHVPDVAYIVCCLRDRIEAWPVAAIAFPRWGTIPPDLPLIVGPCSLTFHPTVEAASVRQHVSAVADSEIETRLSWPGRDFARSFRRPVTIIGDDHPSVLRLHGRGLSTCQFAAVVQDEGFWLVDLSARRMQRSERVRRFREPGETMSLGDATLEYVASKPLSGEQQNDDDVGIGAESGSDPDLHSDDDLHSDIHSVHDLHDEEGQSGTSFIGSGIHSIGSDSSPSFISSPSKGKGSEDSQGEHSRIDHGKSTRTESSESAPSDRDDRNPLPGRGESKAHQSHSIGDRTADASPEFEKEEEESVVRHVSTDVAEPDDEWPECERDECDWDERDRDQSDSSTADGNAYLRVDSGHRQTPRPTAGGSREHVSTDDEGSARAVLNLVDAALGLVDEAVNEPDAGDHGATPQKDSADRQSHDGREPALRVEHDFDEEAAIEDDGNGLDSTENMTSKPTEFESNDQADPSEQTIQSAMDLSADSSQDMDDQTGASEADAIDFAFTQTGASDVALTNHDPPILFAHGAPEDDDPVDVGLTGSEPESELIESEAFSEPDTVPTAETSSTCDGSEDGRETEDEAGNHERTYETRAAASASTEPIKTVRKQEDGEMNPIQPTVNPGNAATGPTHGEFALVPQDFAGPHATETKTDATSESIVSQETLASNDSKPNQVKDSIPGRSSSGEAVQIDPELLTSHLTTRLAEIGEERSVLQQVVRWSAITAGIIVPATVVMWVIHRIYSDWY